MRLKKIHFPNARGTELTGQIDSPLSGSPKAYAIFAHCFTCTKNFKAVAHVASALAHKGFAVLRFDFTGLGESQGEFADTNFSSNVADLSAAAAFLEQHYEAPRVLIGHSFGGTACIQAAMRIPAVKAVATIGSPAEPQHVNHLLQHARKDIETHGEAELKLAGKPIRIKKQFLDDLETAELEKTLPNLDRALLVLHSPMDEVVGIENAARIFQTARHPKSFISLDRSDHMMSNPDDSTYAGAMIGEWVSRYIK